MTSSNRFQGVRKIAALHVALAAVLAGANASAVGLNFVQADDLFLANLTPLSAITSTVDAADNLWGARTGFGIEDYIYESSRNGGEDSPKLTQTISGLTPGASYDLYGAFWTDITANWTVQAGVNSGSLNLSSWRGDEGADPVTGGSKAITAAAAVWDTLPANTTSEGTFFTQRPAAPLIMLLGNAGTAVVADASGQIQVDIDDLPNQGVRRRTWFDGVAYTATGTQIAMEATVDRTTGEISISNPTTDSFQIKSITVESAIGSLDATQWTPITDRLDGGTNGNGTFDTDAWAIDEPLDPDNTPYATQLGESEGVAGDGFGGTLTAGSGTVSYGNVWRASPFQDVEIRLTYDDDTFAIISPTYTGGAAIPLGSFDGDADIDLDDFEILLNGMQTSTAGLTFLESYENGDMTGNAMIDYADYAAFRTAYVAFNGLGSEADLLSAPVPEPSTALGLLAGIAFLIAFLRRPPVACLAVVMILACSLHSRPANAMYAIDIDEAGIAVPEDWETPDFTSLLAARDGTTSSVVVDGITFETLNAQGVRSRTAGGLPNPNTLTGDFLFRDGGDRVGLRIGVPTAAEAGTLPAGRWVVDVWSRDAAVTAHTEIVGYETETNGVQQPDTIISNTVEQNGTAPASTFIMEADGASYYSVFVQGADPDNGQSRGRFNALQITEFTGLTLEVDTTTGVVQILNEQNSDIDLSYYEVRSASGQLSTANWITFDSGEGGDPVGVGWDPVPASNANLLNELNLSSVSTLTSEGSAGDSASLGAVFTPDGTEDVQFLYAAPGDATLQTGFVTYVTSVIDSLDGDYNNDGVVDAIDYAVWRENLGSSVVLNGDTTPGTVTSADYDVWRANYGATLPSPSAAATTPEPAASVLLTFSALTMAMWRGRRMKG